VFHSSDITSPRRPGAPDVVVWEADGSIDGRAGNGRVIAGRLAAAGWSVATVPLTQRTPAEHELAAPAHVLSGGSTPVNDEVEWLQAARRCLGPVVDRALDGSAVVTGICFGSQLIATVLAGPAAVGSHRDGMQAGLVAVGEPGHGGEHVVSSFHYHRIDAEAVTRAGAQVLLASERTDVQAFAAGAGVVGVQFHPELHPRALLRALRRHRSLLERHGTTLARSAASVHALRRAWRDDPWQHLVQEPIARVTATSTAPAAA
jgi:GMP synthase-like glutamine amidotransferase